jgi:hypothetical protein
MKQTTLCGLALAGMLLAGCSTPVFHAPVALSSRSVVAEYVTPLKPVSVKKTGYVFVLIPIMYDPRDGYSELLQAARNAGGDAVMDVQVRMDSGFFWLFPAIVAQTAEYKGTAVRTRR